MLRHHRQVFPCHKGLQGMRGHVRAAQAMSASCKGCFPPLNLFHTLLQTCPIVTTITCCSCSHRQVLAHERGLHIGASQQAAPGRSWGLRESSVGGLSKIARLQSVCREVMSCSEIEECSRTLLPHELHAECCIKAAAQSCMAVESAEQVDLPGGGA